MARPRKKMSDRDRLALDGLLDSLKKGTFVYDNHRHGLGVLRELRPEFAEQLVPHRGRAPANDTKQRVLSHYAILNSPRYRESPTLPRGHLPQQEIVKRIAKTEGITRKHVRALLADEFAEAIAIIEAQDRHIAEIEKNKSEKQVALYGDVRTSYETIVDNSSEIRKVRSMAVFAGTFEIIHRDAIVEVAKTHSLDEASVILIVEEMKAVLSSRLEERTLEILRYR